MDEEEADLLLCLGDGMQWAVGARGCVTDDHSGVCLCVCVCVGVVHGNLLPLGQSVATVQDWGNLGAPFNI